MKPLLHLTSALLCALAIVVAPAGAQGYPDKPIRLIVPYPAGGGVDTSARIFAELLAARLGQPVLVENKPGAASTIGVGQVAKAAPDGYTLLLADSGGITIGPNVKKGVPYSVPKDFTFLSRLLLVPLALSINGQIPVNTMEEFVAYAKAHPGTVRYGSGGIGSGPHFAGLLLEKAAGIKMVHVPYKGSGPNMTDLMGGHIESSFNAVQVVAPLAAAGKIKMLALTGPKRDGFAPNLRTLSELGYPSATVALWYGLLAPSNLPADVAERLRAEAVAVLNSPEAQQKFAAAGFRPDPLAGDVFERYVMDEYRSMKAIAESERVVVED